MVVVVVVEMVAVVADNPIIARVIGHWRCVLIIEANACSVDMKWQFYINGNAVL